ncbi:MAG: DUF364 domain-containing protein [Syntrophobacterales bacterium]|jgi:hypothetical protein|nr:DUF364 domain-containing protein [Syntrophobacterales bacterium]
MTQVYDELKKRFQDICRQRNLLDEKVEVQASALTTEAAIGHPEEQDFPLQKGKERLMQAEFRGAAGQAFTDRFGDFRGSLEEILTMPLENNYRRAVFVATLNAVLKYLGLIRGTSHCRHQDPQECARELAGYLRKRFGEVRVTQVGFQPRMVQEISSVLRLRLLDLDPDNIGTEKFGVAVEGPEKTTEALKWADVLLVTGTTLVNDSIGLFLLDKPLIFYGTTVAGAAYLMGWDRFCPKSI